MNVYLDIVKVIEDKLPDAHILLPEMPLHAFSTSNANSVVSDVLDKMDETWNAATQAGVSPKVIIVGHSTGSLIAKKVYICACGENRAAPFEKEIKNGSQRDWAGNVERLVLLAGMARGWTVNHHLNTSTSILIRIGVLLGFFYRIVGVTPLGFQTKRGAPFVTQIRLQWLSMINANKGDIGKAMVIQLLGTIDDLIPPDDNVDLVTGSSFIYLDVPNSGHVDVLQMNDKPADLMRKKVFIDALTLDKGSLLKDQTVAADTSIIQDATVTDVVFVVHGIRDTGYWTQKIARRVKKLGEQDKSQKFATETSTYGYFPMLPFLLYNQRRSKVEWFMEQYTENKASYPNARFSFVGHSNGTYLLAKALREYPACRFKHVVFAGSVVSMMYDWTTLINDARIKKVYNFVAASDWVVGMFPKAFQRLGLQDIGSGGYDGFKNLEDKYQLKFIRGGHGAALDEQYWNEIARFIVKGEFDATPSPVLAPQKRSMLMNVLGWLAPIPLLAIVGALIWGGYFLFNHFGDPMYKYGSVGLYAFTIWRIVTRF